MEPKVVNKAAESHSELQPVGSFTVLVATVLAWLLPGAGHAYLGRLRRGLIFMAIVLAGLAVGAVLAGDASLVFSGSPLEILKSIARLAIGAPFLLLISLFGYVGEPRALGYEYGGPFIVTAGVMNMLLVLDVWDIAKGRKP